ncbi:MFS transporter [Agrococcus baldri]|uniref:MFS transporter n=1 Tax=Agrococcus baldri TaxID=153730 RepID=A0AA87RCZ8_9MICO|nr:MFS transporter [Agrococcus baldri]GEK80825.1 MFS transporter [Agrococcus baldri]
MTDTTTRTSTEIATGPKHPVAILAVILLSYFMILLDNSVIFTALPSLQRDLGLTTIELTWVQDAYTLVFGGLLLLGARAGDLLGRRRVFIAGLAVFTLASLLIGIATSGPWIIAARALQGVGAAIVAPAALSLLTASFPAGPQRARAIALYSATAGIGASLGLLVGGAAAELLTWRAGFFLNVPIGIAMIALAPRFLPQQRAARGRFDIVGALSATLGVGAIVFGIIHSTEGGWADPLTIAALAAGALLLVVLVVTESRVTQPIMPLHLFSSRLRSGAYAARFLYLGSMIGFFFFLTQYMQGELGFSPLEAGIGFLPMTIVNFAVAMALPPIARRIGETIPLVVGVAATLAGMTWLSVLDPAAGYLWGIGAPMVLIGIGQGLAFGPLTSAGVAGTSAADAGAASGLVNTFHQLGMALGLGILVAVAHGAASAGADLAGEVSAALAAGSGLLALCLIVCLACIVPAAAIARRASHTRAPARITR